MTDVSVALEAMRSDATVWATASDEVDAPHSAIGGLTLTGADVSMWAVDRGLDRTYNNACTALEAMLRQAAESFRSLSDSLNSAADTYQREDEAHMHAMNKINLEGS